MTIADDLTHARSLLAAHRAADAEALCRAVLAAIPDHTEALDILALAAHQVWNQVLTVRRLKAALATAPDSAGLHVTLAFAADQIGDAALAVAAMERSLVLDPGHEHGHHLDGLRGSLRRAQALTADLIRRRAGRSGPAVTVYVKCHSRAAWADRCLCSIKRNLSGHGAIIVLNDGIGEPYLGRLRARHPDVVFRESRKLADGIPATPLTEPAAAGRLAAVKGDHRYDPAAFWAAEIERDPNRHCLVIEEDCWLSRPLDLTGFAAAGGDDVLSLKLLHQIAADAPAEAPPLCLGDPESWGIRTALAGLPDVNVPANAVFSTDFFCYLFADLPHWDAEPAIVSRSFQYLAAMARAGRVGKIAHALAQPIHHSTHTSTRLFRGANEQGADFHPRVFNEAVNFAWYAGELDPLLGLPGDFPAPVLKDIASRYLGPDLAEGWQTWASGFKTGYG